MRAYRNGLRLYGGHFDVDIKKRRYLEIDALEERPDFWNDNRKATQVQKEKGAIKEVLEPFDELHRAVEDSQTLIELSDGTSPDAESLTEIHNNLRTAARVLRELELRQMLSGETDASDCYLSVHAGAGGTEACDWAGILARMYSRYAERQGFKVSVADFTDGDGAGYRSVTFEINGNFAYGYLKAEAGVHRLVRISPFDSNARRHTSFASVFAYPIIEDDIEVNIRSEDLRVDTYRAGGAGGQHVNKTDSAVRMTHIPTGIVVQCQQERSQIQNREKAMKMLRARLYELELQKRQAEADKMHATKKDNAWGSQIRNYVMQPYQLIKDVRTGVETSSVQKVLDGDLQEFIEAFLMGKVNPKGSESDADL